MTARAAGDRTNAADASAPAATSPTTVTTRFSETRDAESIELQLERERRRTGPIAIAGSTTTDAASDSTSPTSKPCDEQSRPSTLRLRTPRNVQEFASQANQVAAAVLRGDIDLDTARVYSAVARTAAQAMTTEVVKARLTRTTPDLEFVNMEEPD